MPYRRNNNYNNRRGMRPTKRFSGAAVRTKKLVDGKSPYTASERMLKTGAGLARTVGALVKDVATVVSLVNSEVKYNDVSVTPPLDPAIMANQVMPLTLVAEGLDENQRTGRSVLGKDITLRAGFTHLAGGDFMYRTFLICDKEDPGGSVPTLAEIFEDPTNVFSGINKDNSERFVIMKSKLFWLNSLSRTSQSQKMYLKIPFHVKYNGTTGTISSADQNQIYFVVISNTGIGDSQYELYSRFNYYDN